MVYSHTEVTLRCPDFNVPNGELTMAGAFDRVSLNVDDAVDRDTKFVFNARRYGYTLSVLVDGVGKFPVGYQCYLYG